MKLYMTAALPRHYVAELADGSRWLILLSASSAPQAWSDARRYKGNYTLEQLPDHVVQLYLPDNAKGATP